MGVGSGEQGGRDPTLDFHAWYRYSGKRLNSAIFWSSFAVIFGIFSIVAPPEQV